MKYKILAIANLLIGSTQLFIALSIVLVVIPQMFSLYEGFAADINPINAYISPVLSFLAGIVNIFLGYMLIRSKSDKLEKYFKISAIYLAFSFTIAAVLAQLTLFSVIGPIYKLTSEL